MSQTITFRKGDVICRKGDLENWMYEIQRGSVAVYINYRSDTERKLTELGAGAFIGELGLLRSIPRSATVIAAEDDTALMKLTAEACDAYFKENPDRNVALVQQLADRLIQLTKDYSEACLTICELKELTLDAPRLSQDLKRRIERFSEYQMLRD
ncbi:MAG: cyclic nucleotide-binding domain-containing protein [Lachnospiraceae bacterium]|nr:cyclic nucleotide-binding domain-containing protein [Lachnospiraceae bacterium]